MKQKINQLSAETEVGEHPDHLHWAASILQKTDKQTDSFSPLYDMSGNLNVPIMFIRGLRQQCRDNRLNQDIFLLFTSLYILAQNKLRTN